jgi:hypothetical protein
MFIYPHIPDAIATVTSFIFFPPNPIFPLASLVPLNIYVSSNSWHQDGGKQPLMRFFNQQI